MACGPQDVLPPRPLLHRFAHPGPRPQNSSFSDTPRPRHPLTHPLVVADEYINVDGGWWNSTKPAKGHPRIFRNASGFPSWDPVKYPRGLPALIEYIHQKGFKYGHYTDAGTGACDHESGMSEGFERQDSRLFAEWKVDMLKVDSCAVHETNRTVVARWKEEITAAGRPMVFSNCHNGCGNDPFMVHVKGGFGWEPWCANDTNSWRTSRDIEPSWAHIMFNLHTLAGIGWRGKPGGWSKCSRSLCVFFQASKKRYFCAAAQTTRISWR